MKNVALAFGLKKKQQLFSPSVPDESIDESIVDLSMDPSLIYVRYRHGYIMELCLIPQSTHPSMDSSWIHARYHHGSIVELYAWYRHESIDVDGSIVDLCMVPLWIHRGARLCMIPSSTHPPTHPSMNPSSKA